jgi:hypothetical protein
LPAVTAYNVLLQPIVALTTFVRAHGFVGIGMNTPHIPAFVLVIDGQTIPVSAEMYEYLKLEAARRGLSEIEVYREEVQAEEELERLTLPRDRLEKASQRDYSHHPWWSGEETKPF